MSVDILFLPREYEIIPFCPEAPLFGTPRERISVVEVAGENRIITDETSKDVTALLEEEIDAFIQKKQDYKIWSWCSCCNVLKALQGE